MAEDASCKTVLPTSLHSHHSGLEDQRAIISGTLQRGMYSA